MASNQKGGGRMLRCWFCGKEIKDAEVTCFSFEWDAFYHNECYLKALANGSEEAKIIKAERG